MKYIKLFENINNGYTREEWGLDRIKVINFDRKEISKLESMFDTEVIVWDISGRKRVTYLHVTIPAGSVIAGISRPHVVDLSDHELNIFKSRDEWYYVKGRGNRYCEYKCDQLDGLINFLNDVKSKKIKNIYTNWGVQE